MEEFFLSQAELDAAEPALSPYGTCAAGRLAANDDAIAENDDAG